MAARRLGFAGRASHNHWIRHRRAPRLVVSFVFGGAVDL
jgi:hypothetical protein